jgi:hypothetical protein
MLGKQLVERGGGPFLKAGDHVAVEVQGDPDLGVTEQLADHLRVHAGAQQQRRCRVPNVVEPDPGQLEPLEQRVELALHDVIEPSRESAVSLHSAVRPKVRSKRGYYSRWAGQLNAATRHFLVSAAQRNAREIGKGRPVS